MLRIFESFFEGIWVLPGHSHFFLASLFPMQICNLIYLMADSELCALKNQSKIVIVFFHELYLNSYYHLSYFFSSWDYFFKNTFLKIKFTYHTIYPLEVYNSVTSSIFTELCTPHLINFRTFSSYPKEAPYLTHYPLFL